MTMKFSATKEEYRKIMAIVKRATHVTDKLTLDMDITATHCNGCALDLDKLLNLPKFDFYHDVYGIMQNIDRNTGKLQNCFLPRCSA